MRKLIVFSCMLILLAASLVNATQTRVLTMGEIGTVIRDDVNVHDFPQTLRMYPNFGTAEITGANFTTSGWHMAYGDFVVGGYWTTQGWSNGYLPDFNGNNSNDDALDQKFSLLYARDLGGMPFGFTFELFGNGEENKGADKSTMSGLGMKIGAGMTFMETLETSLKIGMLSWEQKDAAGITTAENEGGTSIAVNARYWMPETPMGVMVPHLMFMTESGGVKPASLQSTKDDRAILEIGFGGYMMAGEKTMIVHDLGIKTMSRTWDDGVADDKEEWSYNMIPYFKGGMEGPLGEHFMFRCGGVKEWITTTHKNGSDEHNTSGAATRLYIGFGYMRGAFTLDADVKPAFFTNGPYFITGAPGALANQVSLSYKW